MTWNSAWNWWNVVRNILLECNNTLFNLYRNIRRNSKYVIFCLNVTIHFLTYTEILGVTVRNDLKWNDHVDNITAKASQRIYLLKQLKHAGIDRKSLIQFYCACIRSVPEYACQAFHCSLPPYLSDQIERVPKRVLRILFP